LEEDSVLWVLGELQQDRLKSKVDKKAIWVKDFFMVINIKSSFPQRHKNTKKKRLDTLQVSKTCQVKFFEIHEV